MAMVANWKIADSWPALAVVGELTATGIYFEQNIFGKIFAKYLADFPSCLQIERCWKWSVQSGAANG